MPQITALTESLLIHRVVSVSMCRVHLCRVSHNLLWLKPTHMAVGPNPSARFDLRLGRPFGGFSPVNPGSPVLTHPYQRIFHPSLGKNFMVGVTECPCPVRTIEQRLCPLKSTACHKRDVFTVF